MRGLIAVSTLLAASLAFPSFNQSIRVARQAKPNKAWPNALIPIGFRSDYPQAWRNTLREGIKLWTSTTCVRFRENDVTSKDRVEVYDGGQCSSDVGRSGGKQTFSFGNGCQGVSTAGHELGHAIGLHHMQVRPDRDQYVTINKNNIHPGAYDINFGIDRDTNTMGVPYDYSSLLHYGPYHFGQEGKPGMVPRDSRFKYSMGGIYPSFYDVMRANKVYNCAAKCTGTGPRCLNNGVRDVNNCDQCFCPLGYGGKDCGGKPAGATVVTATSAEQKFATTIGQPSDPQSIDYKIKHLVINAPAGKRVQLKVTYFWVSFALPCSYGFIEIYTKTDTRTGAARLCKTEWLDPSYTSDGSRMYVRMASRYMQSNFQLTYKAV
ncbi:hypothetical protein PFISCL1PPCAC_28182 [Pristionchus fissidentatus]|uniref:Zinc metalloproteinase n=1 Tax=Pristionchus fissidentatus TaxID=1538716 RepID=A0AAV5X1M3_9BILA|nr:hypothetical protein PFISCL1PPCAC_28182 [Pristionchus fissidentatus]